MSARLSLPVGGSADDARTWYTPVGRAAVAAAVAIIVTFSADHSASLGFLTFGLFAVLSGAVLAISAVLARHNRITRSILLAQGVIAIAAGSASLALWRDGLPFFTFLLTAFAVTTGFLELYLGVRGRDRAARDRLFVGGLTVALAALVLLVPPGFSQSFTGPDGVPRQLTASVFVVGTLGAYWAILAIYLAIAGLSLKWSASAGRRGEEPLSAGGAPGGRAVVTTPSRRERMRPLELLAISGVLAIFAGLVVLISTRDILLALIFLGIAFIVSLVVLAMLALAAAPTGAERIDLDEQDRGQGH